MKIFDFLVISEVYRKRDDYQISVVLGSFLFLIEKTVYIGKSRSDSD